jgi:hypothetical protein
LTSAARRGGIEGFPTIASSSELPSPNFTPEQLSDRSARSRQERVVLSQIFAGFVGTVAVINAVPSTIRWLEWLNQSDDTLLPIWVFILMFVSGWHLLFVVMLVQIPDWGTMRVTAIAMLAVIVFYGIAATMLTLMNGNQWLGHTLQLAESENGRAGMWCFAMMCLGVIVSLAAARESSRWRRMEELTAELRSEEIDKFS